MSDSVDDSSKKPGRKPRAPRKPTARSKAPVKDVPLVQDDATAAEGGTPVPDEVLAQDLTQAQATEEAAQPGSDVPQDATPVAKPDTQTASSESDNPEIDKPPIQKLEPDRSEADTLDGEAGADTPADDQTAAVAAQPTVLPEMAGRGDANFDPPSSRSGQAARALVAALGHDLGVARRRLGQQLSQARETVRRRAGTLADTRRAEVRETTPTSLAASLRRAVSRLSVPRKLSGLFARGTSSTASTRRGGWRMGIALVGLAGFLLVACVLIWALQDVPWQKIADGALKPSIVLETADGQPLVRQGPFQGPPARYEAFPQHLIDAVISIEDRRFPDHHGIDLFGISRALVRNLQAGSVVQGGSTITQQLIKVLYLESDRTLKRKIQEVVIAFWLEWKLGKQDILTRYLNSVYLGAGATGMPAAARIYFNKDVGDLDIRESAMLAGLLKAPSQLNPIDNFDGARERTTVVLDAMVENGKLTATEATAAKAEFATLHVTPPTPRSGSWFADWVTGQAREIAGATPGALTVRTTLVPRLQQAAEAIVAKALDEEGGALGASQAALVAMTPDGAVVAMVGGRDYKASQFNRAVTAMRQPGSTFKLFVYYAALKAGFTLGDSIDDAPIDIDGWRPENSGGGFRGRVSLAEAFARSLNAATVALAQEVGIDAVIAAARELGIEAPLAAGPALALGASEVSLIDLTGAYASVRAGKAPVEPWGVIDFQAEAQPRAFRIGPQVKPTTDLSVYQPDLVTLLQLVVERGTGREAAPGGFAAGKTGTSQDNKDAWFVGFTEPLVVGVWVGNDDGTPMKGVTGGALPARIWRDFMQTALAEPAPEDNADTSTGDAQSAPSCNIRACAQTYRSFRPSDCTYQPYRGERRLCER